MRSYSNSSYTRAIACINETRTVLAQHIVKQITEAQINSFTDPILSQTIVLRCEVVRLLKQLVIKHTKIDINIYQNALNNAVDIASEYLPKGSEMGIIAIKALEILAEYIINDTKSLDQELQKKHSNANRLMNTTVLSLEAREQIKTNLCILTKLSSWKINPKNHLEAWIEIPLQEDAEKTAALLKSMQIGIITLTKRADNHIPVVKCSALIKQHL